MTPTEANGRRLVEVLAKYFPRGCNCGDLRQKYQKVAHRKSGTFFNALKLAREKNWIVSDGGPLRLGLQIYSLNPDGCWRNPEVSIEERLETARRENSRLEFLLDTQVERTEQLQSEIDNLRDLASGTNGIALENLIKIVTDITASPRQRLKAASVILGYRVQNSEVSELAKRYLETLCASAENVDYRIEASEVLRRCEDPRIAPSVQRPVVAVVYDSAEEVMARGERRRKHIEAQALRNAEEMAREQQEMAARAPMVRN
jgi:hypothetical protein